MGGAIGTVRVRPVRACTAGRIASLLLNDNAPGWPMPHSRRIKAYAGQPPA